MAGTMTDVVTFGEAMAALRGDGPLRLGGPMQLSMAGAETNVAIGLARLGHAVSWIGRTGADELGELVRRTLRAEGVDIADATVDPDRPTGLLLRERRVADTVRVSYYRRGSAGSALTADDVLPALRRGARWLHVTGITAALSEPCADAVRVCVRAARAAGVRISLDVNHRSALWPATDARAVLAPLGEAVSVVFASEDELPLLAATDAGDTTEIARALIDGGAELVVVKQGAAGATAYSHGSVTSVAAPVVPVVDLVGAGDAFVAGALSALLDGKPPSELLRRAVATAAFAVAGSGDWEALPHRDELPLLELPDGTVLR
jgi:2-dehydro-3-deoxygluconokinase